jgi:hypothetical protein
MSKVLYVGDSAIKLVLGIGIEVFPLMEQIWDAGTYLQDALEGFGHASHRCYLMIAHKLPKQQKILPNMMCLSLVILATIPSCSIRGHAGMRYPWVQTG